MKIYNVTLDADGEVVNVRDLGPAPDRQRLVQVLAKSHLKAIQAAKAAFALLK